jgi:glycosyltransferase involved in cell wall biosynthesis
MSSGLVPVTTDCSAISEFVSKDTGLLCEPESVDSLAKELSNLVENPERFSALSNQVSKAVRQKCELNAVIRSEMAAIDS